MGLKLYNLIGVKSLSSEELSFKKHYIISQLMCIPVFVIMFSQGRWQRLKDINKLLHKKYRNKNIFLNLLF